MHQVTAATFVDAVAVIEQVQAKLPVPGVVTTLEQIKIALADLYEQICEQADGTEDLKIAGRYDYHWALEGVIELLTLPEGIPFKVRDDLVPELRSMCAALQPERAQHAPRGRRTCARVQKRQRVARRRGPTV